MSVLRSPRPVIATAVLLLLLAPKLSAESSSRYGEATHPWSGAEQTDSAAVAHLVHRFHAALEAGDSATALALLSDDAVILESGGTETKEEYRSHHLPADIAFARAVRREAGPLRVVVRGDAAWASSTSVMRGTFRDRPVNSRSAELMVLVRAEDGWRIAAIHWSSRSPGSGS